MQQFILEAVERRGGFHGSVVLERDGRASLSPSTMSGTRMSFAEAWCVMRLAYSAGAVDRKDYKLSISEAR